MRRRANLREAGTQYFQVEMLVILLPGSSQSSFAVGRVSFKMRPVDTTLVSKKSTGASAWCNSFAVMGCCSFVLSGL